MRILLDQKQREAAFAMKFAQIAQRPRLVSRGLKPERRLVEHHQARGGEQAAADRQHLLLAAGQHRGGKVADAPQDCGKRS